MPSTGETPVLVTHNGIPYWQTSGRTFPVVAGGEDQPPNDGNDGDTQDDDFDKDRALRTIKRQRENEKALRDEARALKERLDALEADKRKREDAERSETEKLAARAEEMSRAQSEAEAKAKAAEDRYRALLVDQEIERAAQKHGAVNPVAVTKLLDRDKLEYDEAGLPTNAERLVKKLLEDETYLVAGGQSGRPGVPSSPRSSGQPTRSDQVKEAEDKLIQTRQYQPFG